MRKNVCLIVGLMFFIMLFTGCSPVTTVNMSKEGKGVASYTFALSKNYIDNAGYTSTDNIDELVSILKSKFEPTLNLEVAVDKETSNEEYYITISFVYNSVEEYNDKVEAIIKANNTLISGVNIYDIYGYDKEDDSKDYTVELNALKEYMDENGIYMDIDNRNCRKFVKIIKEYIEYDESYVTKGDKVDLKNSTTDENIKADSKDEYVKIVQKGSNKALNINFMALNCIEMYVRKVVEKYKEDIFNVQFIEENSKDITKLGKKEILKRTFATFDLATKVKDAIDKKNGVSVECYSMNDFTPVMSVTLFDESISKEFTKLYSKEYDKYEIEKKQATNELKLTFDDMEDMYIDRINEYEINFENNSLSFNGDELFDLYNDDGYIELIGMDNNSDEVATGIGNIKGNNENINHENDEKNVLSNNAKESESKNLNLKEGKIAKIFVLDDTPFTGDNIDVTLIIMVICAFVITSVGILLVIKKYKRI